MMSTTDCSKEEGMCSLVDAVSLRCLDLSIRNRNIFFTVNFLEHLIFLKKRSIQMSSYTICAEFKHLF